MDLKEGGCGSFNLLSWYLSEDTVETNKKPYPG
jgi:hypothetical protein